MAKAMATVFERVPGSCLSLVLVLMLTWSSPALCGEIHEAVKSNDSARVRELIKNNPDLVFSKDEDGFTPLHLAAANGYKSIAEFLLATKAEVNSRDNAGSTPLHQAATAEGEHTSVVELLLAHEADVNAADRHGLTPLHYATLANNRDVVKSLLYHGANANAKDNEVGDTPLILAAGKGYKEVTELLLEHGADVNAADNIGTPMAWAMRAGHADVANLLRQHGGHE
jgi:ankyrin repeat protein